jgi:hypothetical protein
MPSQDTSGTEAPPSPSLHPTPGPPRPKGRGGSVHSRRTRAKPATSQRRQRPLAGRIPKRTSKLHQGRAHEQETRRAPADPEIKRRHPRGGPLAIARRARARHSYGGQAPGRFRTGPPPKAAVERNARAVSRASARTALRGGRRAGHVSFLQSVELWSPSAGKSRRGPRPAPFWCRPHRPTSCKSRRLSSCRACPRARGDAAVPAGGTVRRLPCASARRSRDARRGRRGP